MPRTFSKNTANYGTWGLNQIGPRINGAAAITTGVRFRATTVTSVAGENGLMLVFHGDNSGVGLAIGDGTAARVIAFGRAQQPDPQIIRSATTTVTTAAWHTAFAVWEYAVPRLKIYYDDVLEYDAAETYGRTSYLDATNTFNDQIGQITGAVMPPPVTGPQLNGEIDWVAIWNTAVSASDISAMHSGAWPGAVQPSSLREFNIMTALRAPETSMVSGGTSFAVVGSLPSASGASFWTPWRGPNARTIGGY